MQQYWQEHDPLVAQKLMHPMVIMLFLMQFWQFWLQRSQFILLGQSLYQIIHTCIVFLNGYLCVSQTQYTTNRETRISAKHQRLYFDECSCMHVHLAQFLISSIASCRDPRYQASRLRSCSFILSAYFWSDDMGFFSTCLYHSSGRAHERLYSRKYHPGRVQPKRQSILHNEIITCVSRCLKCLISCWNCNGKLSEMISNHKYLDISSARTSIEPISRGCLKIMLTKGARLFVDALRLRHLSHPLTLASISALIFGQ